MVTHAQHVECNAVTVARDATCVDIADEMDIHSIGCVVVVEGGAPVGIITDRDLVCRVVAEGLDPEKTVAEDIMSKDLVTTDRKDDIESLLETMRSRNIRRLPIVSEGQVVGLVSLDDILIQLGSYLFNANRGILGGLQESHRTTRHRRRAEAREEALEEIRRQLSEFGESAQKAVQDGISDLLDRFGRKG